LIFPPSKLTADLIESPALPVDEGFDDKTESVNGCYW